MIYPGTGSILLPKQWSSKNKSNAVVFSYLQNGTGWDFPCLCRSHSHWESLREVTNVNILGLCQMHLYTDSPLSVTGFVKNWPKGSQQNRFLVVSLLATDRSRVNWPWERIPFIFPCVLCVTCFCSFRGRIKIRDMQIHIFSWLP